ILLLQAPRDSKRWFVPERFGLVRVFDNNESVASSSIFLDLKARVEATCAECGLLGMAFHPDFPATPRVYITYTSLHYTGNRPDTHLSEFTSPDGGLTLDPASERIILTIQKPTVHHHGGHIAFGPDGFLYFGTGDGNGAKKNAAQTLTTLLGKMLRIDIRGTTGNALYRIPAGNPFAASTELCGEIGSGTQNCPEIYALGFRNPWRWSFDRQSGELWVGDVGQADWEEIDRVELGKNYGWDSREGAHCFEPATGCSTAGLTDPVAEYGHDIGFSII